MKEEANETLQTFAADMFALICGSTDFNKMAKLVGTFKKRGGAIARRYGIKWIS